jgi:hypothetical protein
MATTTRASPAASSVSPVVERGVAGADGLVDDGEGAGDAEVVVEGLGEVLGQFLLPRREGVVRSGSARWRNPSIRSTAAAASASDPSWYSIIER